LNNRALFCGPPGRYINISSVPLHLDGALATDRTESRNMALHAAFHSGRSRYVLVIIVLLSAFQRSTVEGIHDELNYLK